jgi:pSer/pThr/pTyr-binding forkhead associated (FHA) protein
MPKCPVCDQEVETGGAECPNCGARLAEPTASFEPVSVPVAETHANPASDGPLLVVRKGPQPGERFFIDRARLSVGRDPESDIFLNDITVSRTHAILEYEDGVASVKDAGSLNGTYVNGEVVEAAVLGNGDVVQIGTFQMLFLSGPGVA